MEVEWDIHGIHARLNEKIESVNFGFFFSGKSCLTTRRYQEHINMGQKINDEIGNYGRYIYIYIYQYNLYR